MPNEPQAQSTCIACGPAHPHGLRLRFAPRDGGGVDAQWTPAPTWEGYAGVVHGGIVGTVLDEAMSKAVAALRRRALTGELRVRYRDRVLSGEAYRVEGWVVSQRRRLTATEARLTRADGVECAHAWATFVDPPAQRRNVS